MRAALDEVPLEDQSRMFRSSRQVEPGQANSTDDLDEVDRRAVCFMYDLEVASRVGNPEGVVDSTPEARAAATLLLSEWKDSAEALRVEQLLVEHPEWDPAASSTVANVIDEGVPTRVAEEYLRQRHDIATTGGGNPDVRLLMINSSRIEDQYWYVDLADPPPREPDDSPAILRPNPFNVRFEPEGKTIRIGPDLCG